MKANSILARTVRAARPADLPAILMVLEAARGIMAASGNLSQWRAGYPAEADILRDMDREGGFVVQEAGRVVAYFAFLPSPEPTYATIHDGSWLEDTRPYHVIHRLASYPEVHGIFRTVLDWCAGRDRNLRIDTHRDNRIMQHCILQYGFRYCGIIHLANGDERLAYQLPAG